MGKPLPQLSNIMAKNNITWSKKGSIVSETLSFAELEKNYVNVGDNRYCPAYFELDEVITFPEKKDMEFFARSFKKRDGKISHSIMVKVHSSKKGEYFADITDFLRIPIPAECGEFFKESPISYILLKVMANDIQRIKHLMGKTLKVHMIKDLHRAGWYEDADGNLHSSDAPEHVRPLTCWCWMEI